MQQVDYCIHRSVGNLMEDNSQYEYESTPLLSSNTSGKVPWFGYRHLMTLLLLFACSVSYSMRVDLSIGIVAMVDKNNSNPDFEEFDWDSTTQNTILSSFFWGYIITQVPSGLIAQYLGAKMLLFYGIAISSIGTLLTPVVASNGGVGGMIALRVICGLSQGTLFPSMHSVLAQWVPPKERGRMAAIAFAGSQLGTIITLALGGILASGDGGWPSIFYVFGALGLVWCIVWFFFASSTPREHRIISKAEKNYILSQLGAVKQSRQFRTPWLSIFTSIPMWGVILAHCSQNWGYWILMTEMPTYMKSVLKFDIKSNGLLSALPYLVMCILSFILGFVGDKLISSGYLKVSLSRKLFNTIGFWGPAAALCGLGYVNKDNVALGVALLVLSVGLNSGCYIGFQINHMDLAPNFASTLMGITNGLANILSIVGPLAVGIIVTDEGSNDEWRIVFFISAAVYFVGNIIFAIMGSTEVQPWNDPQSGKSVANSNDAEDQNNEKERHESKSNTLN